MGEVKLSLSKLVMYAAIAGSAWLSPISGMAMKLGVATHFEQGWGTEWLAKAKSVGADLIRDEQGWGKIELTRGNYEFPASQSNYLQLAASERIPALLVFTSGNTLYDSGYTPYTAEGRQAYANYIAAVLNKYGPAVKEIEVWNEFNGNYTGPGAADRTQSYTQLLKTVWDTVKPLHPDVQILGGSTNAIGTGAIESLFKLGALSYMDGVVVHPYRNNPEHVDDELFHLQDVMAKYGAVKPIYATELSNNFANAAEAPAWMVKMVTLLSSAKVAEADWYSLVDEPWFQNMGLFTPGGEAKPAAAAFSFMQTLLDKGDAIRVNPNDDLTPIYRYGADTFVMWSVGQNVSFTPGSHVYNAMGQEIAAPTKLGMTPVVVKGGYTLGDTNVVADSLMQFNEGDWQYFAKNSSGAMTKLENIDWEWTSFLGTKWTNPLRVNADAVTPFGDASNPIQVVERFVSDRAQTIKINATWKTGTGDGVDLHVLVNNVEVLTKVFQGAFSLDGYTVNLKAGDKLDFALGPNQLFGGDDTDRRITLYRVDGVANATSVTGATISGTGNTANGELVQGTTGDDTIQGLGGPNDTLMGGAGNDVIFAHVIKTSPQDAINDAVQITQRDSSVIRGEDGDDVIYGGAGFDDINGNKGDDTIHGGLGNDWVVGGQGADLLFGDKGDDIVYGNLGNDTLFGGDGNDSVRGGQGDDVIDGGAGDDWLWGDRGNDVITGGAGADQFRFLTGSGADRVTDFSIGQGDKVVVEGLAHWTVSQAGADTVITLDSGDTLTLSGVALSSLAGRDWIVGAP